VHTYADNSQLYFHVDPAAVDNKVQPLVDCVDEISHWMSANRLKLNKDRTQFIWLNTPHQQFKLDCQTISLGGVVIKVSAEAMRLAVRLDSTLTFAPHVRCVPGKSFYHLRQLKTVRRSLSEAAAKTMVPARPVEPLDESGRPGVANTGLHSSRRSSSWVK